MMKINNLQMLNIWTIFNKKFEQTKDIKTKWKITEIAKEVYEVKSRFDQQKDMIINEYGDKDDDGTMSLSFNNEYLQELFVCESEITPINIESLDGLNFSFEELMVLKPILTIKED